MIEAPKFFKNLKDWNYEARDWLEKEDLSAVCGLLFLIRGTARAFGYFQIAYIAGLGEDIAIYGVNPRNRGEFRKCVGSVWDVLTTLEYLIQNGFETTTDEQKILIFRLEATLKALGHFREKLTQSEIDVLVRAAQQARDAVPN